MENFKTNYPFIPNQNTYYVQDKLIYINSEDRNVKKYPNPSQFEIILPTDIVNVATIQLKNWMIPTIINTFSQKNNNLVLEFSINEVAYGKFLNDGPNLAPEYVALVNQIVGKFIIMITPGDYQPEELANEIQNRMNVAINDKLLLLNAEYYNSGSPLPGYVSPTLYVDYTFFTVAWNNINKKFIFINTLNPFVLNNDSMIYLTDRLVGDIFNPCCNEKLYSSFSYYGLPAYLGFNQIKEESLVCNDKNILTFMQNTYLGLPTPLFQQNFDGNNIAVNYVIPPSSYTLVKTPEIFLDVQSFNCVDATKPYNDNRFTQTTNQGNGNMNSFLGKIPMIADTNTFSSSNGGGDYQSTANFNPPLERVRKFIISLRNHDASLVDFGFNNWSITLCLESYIPTQNVKITKTPF